MAIQQPDWRDAGDGSAWVIGTRLTDSDVERLAHIRYLTLWDSTVPNGFVQRLPALELLDLRGARSAAAVAQVGGHPSLRALAVSHSRTLVEVDEVGLVSQLEFLDLYGLSKLESLPPLGDLHRLRRLNLGQMIRLEDWSELASAPALRELWLVNRVLPDLATFTDLASSGSLEAFLWDAPDEAAATVASVTRTVNRPPASRLRIRDLWES